MSPQPFWVQCPKWFLPELRAKFTAIGVEPTYVRETPVRHDEPAVVDRELDVTCDVFLPWDIDVPRVKFMLELCNLCVSNLFAEKTRQLTGESRSSWFGPLPDGTEI